MLPTISIIVPCYNQAQFLEEALNSTFLQTYQGWQCIIVNDGSLDNTETVAKEWCKKDNRFEYILKANEGLSSARNTGIENAIGEFILPLDADDLIHPNYIELAVSSFLENDRLSMVYCKAKKFGLEVGEWDLEDYDYLKLLLSNHIFCSAIYRKKDWVRVGGYDEQLKSGFEDWAFWIKILNENSLVYKIPEYLFSYRIKSSSMLRDMSNHDQELAKWHIFIDNMKIYERNFVAPITAMNEILVLKQENAFLHSKIKNILNSKSFKLGNLFIKPLSYFKDYIKTKRH